MGIDARKCGIYLINLFRMRVKLRDKLLLGDNISKFVRKASNPENLKFMLGVTNTHRKQSSVTMSPLQ